MFVLILSNKDIYEIKSSGICLTSWDYNVNLFNHFWLCLYDELSLYIQIICWSQNMQGYVFLIASLIMYLVVRVHFILRQYSDAIIF